MLIGSLFSGIGGLELGLERAGLGRVAWQCEMDPYCRAVLARHWPDAARYDDVRSIDGSAARVDVVCGGFPCQPVSVAGRRLAQADERWLWPEFARVARELRPAVVVVENVPGLRSAGLRDVLADLAALGFDAEWSTLAASDTGAPHIRRRLFIVAAHPDRIELREQPGWLSRACRARAAGVGAGHLQAPPEPRRGAPADAAGVRGEWPEGDRGREARPSGGERGRCDGEATGLAPADADREGQPQPGWSFAALRGWARDSGWWHAPPALRGVDDGTSAGLDACDDDARGRSGEASDGVEAPDGWRIKALGNAVVPQVAEVIGRALVDAISRGSTRGSVGAAPAPATETPGFSERATGIEPATFSLGSKQPALGYPKAPTKPHDRRVARSPTGDGK